MIIEQQVLRLWQKCQPHSIWAPEEETAFSKALIGQGLLSFALPNTKNMGLFNRSNPCAFSLQLHYLTQLQSQFLSFAMHFYEHETLPITGDTEEWISLRNQIRMISKQQFLKNIEALVFNKTNAYMRGMIEYHLHPYHRSLGKEGTVIWSCGSTTLREFSATDSFSGEQTTILLIPSLINNAYILDLMPEYSLVGFLKKKGYRVLLLDWGMPQQEENFGFEDYLFQRLIPATHFIQSYASSPLVAFGYCMGGIFAMALAGQIALSGVILIATPWDFHEGSNGPAQPFLCESILRILEHETVLPADVLTGLFYALHPERMLEKFESFAQWTDPVKKRLFVALEDWAGDTIPMAKGLAYDVIHSWQHKNELFTGKWGDEIIKFKSESLMIPALIVSGSNDRICRAKMSAPLESLLLNVTVAQFEVGHTGLIVGQTAKQEIWPLIDTWLQTIPNDCYTENYKKEA